MSMGPGMMGMMKGRMGQGRMPMMQMMRACAQMMGGGQMTPQPQPQQQMK